MLIPFTKKVPDDLYIDSFNNNKSISLEYDGPAKIYLLIDKLNGSVSSVLETSEDKFNPDLFTLHTLDAESYPDVAHYILNSNIVERQFETETLVDGTTYEKMINPTLKDYYRVTYDLENKKWVWEVITVDPKSIRNIMADRYRDYINENISKISGDAALKKLASDYLSTLDSFEKTGKGSIPSWKIIEAKISEVPMIPQELIAAFNVLP